MGATQEPAKKFSRVVAVMTAWWEGLLTLLDETIDREADRNSDNQHDDTLVHCLRPVRRQRL